MAQDKIALVTGASGFTGRHLLDLLHSRGFRVVAMGNTCTDAADSVACDLTDRDAVRDAVQRVQPTHVVHLAALSFVQHGDARAFYDVNVFGTLHVLDALTKLAKVPTKVLVASSANVYGTPDVEVIDEGVCPAPVNHYACSKLAMEHMVRNWFDKLPIIVTRPFNYTGPGQDERFLVPKIVGHYRRNARVIELGNLDVSRDFSDVRDVVQVYAELLESDARSCVVNVCSGTDISLREILRMMSDIAGYAIEVQVNPAFVRANEIARLRGSQGLLRQIVSHVPSTPFASTLRAMYEDAHHD